MRPPNPITAQQSAAIDDLLEASDEVARLLDVSLPDLMPAIRRRLERRPRLISREEFVERLRTNRSLHEQATETLRDLSLAFELRAEEHEDALLRALGHDTTALANLREEAHQFHAALARRRADLRLSPVRSPEG